MKLKILIALWVVLYLSSGLSGCFLDDVTSDESTASVELSSDDSQLDNSSYQNILDQLNDLETILNSLDTYTEEDMTIPTP